MSDKPSKAEAFRALHVPGDPFILGNAWDAGSALMLSALGAKALASTSAGHAFTLGRPDMGHVTRDEAIEHAAMLADATPLPVSGDLENGYGHSKEDVVATVEAAFNAGLAGCSIEDTRLPDTAPYDFSESIERIEAAVDCIKGLSGDIVLTARADGVMNGHYDTAEAIRRLKAYDEAGADVLYAPLPPDLEAVAEICRQVDKPINVLCAGRFTKHTMAEFANVGVARVSLGSALARVTHNAILNCAKAMFEHGDMSHLGDAASGDLIDGLLQDGLE